MSGRRRLPLEQALLGSLMQRPMHGYDLHQQIEGELGEVWYMGISNIYGALKQLEQSGQVEFDLFPQEGRPPRKVYRITPAGRKGFLDWLRKPVSAIRDIRIEFPTKLHFFRVLGLDGVGDLISVQEGICQRRIERLEQGKAQWSSHNLNWLVFDFRQRQVEAILGWLQLCREEWV